MNEQMDEEKFREAEETLAAFHRKLSKMSFEISMALNAGLAVAHEKLKGVKEEWKAAQQK